MSSKYPCPPWFPRDARLFWRRYLPMLEAEGRFEPSDVAAFTSMALNWGQLMQAHRELAKDGLTVLSSINGKMSYKRHPAAVVAKETESALRAQFQQFGMTPASRDRVPGLPRELEDSLLD